MTDGILKLRERIQAADGQQAINGITAAALLEKIFPEPRWAIPGILPEGLNLLAGKPKKGKSIFALNIGLSISLGGLALGKIPVEQGPVLYLALEDTERRLQQRLKHMLAYSDRAPEGLHLFTKWPNMDAGGLDLLEAKILEIQNPRLVIIDTLQKFRPPAKSNANLYAEDYGTVTQIKEVADRLGVCILLIHHLRKAESDDIFDTLSGSLGLTGGTDGNLVMQNIRGDTILHVTGRDVEGKELALVLDPKMLAWQLLGDRAEVQATSERQTLFNAMKNADSEVTPKELVEITGLKPQYVKKALAHLCHEGTVKRIDRGKYIYYGTIGTIGTIGTTGTIGTIDI